MSLWAILAALALAVGGLVWAFTRGRQAGRDKERVNTTRRANEILDKQRDAAADRPDTPDALRRRMRDGRF